MDVGDPSNFIRIREIYLNDFDKIKENISSYSFSDTLTKEAMLEVYTKLDYIMDPHGAVGYLGLKAYLKDHSDVQGIFVETAHPVKFLEVVEPVIGKSIELPEQIKAVIHKPKEALCIKNYSELKDFLIRSSRAS